MSLSHSFNALANIQSSLVHTLPNHEPWTMVDSLPKVPDVPAGSMNEARLQRQTLWNRFSRVPGFPQLNEAQRTTLLYALYFGSKMNEHTTDPEDLFSSVLAATGTV